MTHPFFFTSDQKWTIALLKLLDDMNAPDYAFTAVLKWAQGESEEGYSFHPMGGQSRMQNIDVLFNSVKNANRLLPRVKRVNVPRGPACDVIIFEFALQLLSLLQNPALTTAVNLAIDIANPLASYSSASLGEAMSSTVYRDAYARFISNPNSHATYSIHCKYYLHTVSYRIKSAMNSSAPGSWQALGTHFLVH